jgi:polysaccharide deacetylase 2 family uncharacterized protein YibQ
MTVRPERNYYSTLQATFHHFIIHIPLAPLPYGTILQLTILIY